MKTYILNSYNVFMEIFSENTFHSSIYDVILLNNTKSHSVRIT